MATEPRDTAARQTLADLLAGIADDALTADVREHSVSGVFDDSRQVQPDGVFVAIRGTDADGRKFVGDALARGASVLIGEDLPPGGEAIVINVENARATLARLAARWYGLEGPAVRDFRLLAITGTQREDHDGLHDAVDIAGRRAALRLAEHRAIRPLRPQHCGAVDDAGSAATCRSTCASALTVALRRP